MFALELLIFLPLAFIVGEIFNKLSMPRLLGYVVFGIFVGNMYEFVPFEMDSLNYVHSITQLALSVILLKAGMGISTKALKKVGGRAAMLGALPNIAEGFIVMVLARALLDFDWIEAGILGFAINAVSPAVVIPTMSKIGDNGYGKDSGITTMNLASASIDDVVSLTIFSVFLNLKLSGSIETFDIIKQPLILVNGLVFGLIFGLLYARLFKPKWKIGRIFGNVYKKIFRREMATPTQFIQYLIIISTIAGLFFLNEMLYISMSVGVMMLAFVMVNKNEKIKPHFVRYTNIVWKFAQVALFFIIGAVVNLNKMAGEFEFGILIIIIGVLVRVVVSFLVLYKSSFSIRERIFNGLANIPKATVQATIGSVALSNGLEIGETVLAISVLSILLTAPVGLILLETTYKKLLKKDTTPNSLKNTKM